MNSKITYIQGTPSKQKLAQNQHESPNSPKEPRNAEKSFTSNSSKETQKIYPQSWAKVKRGLGIDEKEEPQMNWATDGKGKLFTKNEGMYAR